jgi:hypothetical protein
MIMPPNHAAAKLAGASQLQSLRPVRWVAELGRLARMTAMKHMMPIED